MAPRALKRPLAPQVPCAATSRLSAIRSAPAHSSASPSARPRRAGRSENPPSPAAGCSGSVPALRREAEASHLGTISDGLPFSYTMVRAWRLHRPSRGRGEGPQASGGGTVEGSTPPSPKTASSGYERPRLEQDVPDDDRWAVHLDDEQPGPLRAIQCRHRAPSRSFVLAALRARLP